MPNTLAHLGIQTVASRVAIRGADVRWVFLGAIVPDIPWIAGRATRTLLPALHDHDLWAYYIAQSSLAVSLLLCGALAALAVEPRRAFGILGLNATIHLIFDGLQTRWGNGVHLFAPISWEFWNAGWFGLDSWPVWVFTALGVAVAPLALWRARYGPKILELTPRRLAWAAAFLGLYACAPILLRSGVFAADAHSVATLRDRSQRTGRLIELDRTAYRVRAGSRFIQTYGGDTLRVANAPLDHSAIISIRARFMDDSTLSIDAFQDHSGSPRDTLNYLGLALVAACCVAGLGSRGRDGRVANGIVQRAEQASR